MDTTNSLKPDFYNIQLRKGLFCISAPEWDAPDSNVNCWLVLGHDKALLIDAGLPCSGLKEYVKQMVGRREIQLALSHGHFDHTGALHEFNNFWMNPEDEPVLQGKDGLGLPPVLYSGKLHPMYPGDLIELGGRTLDVWGFPAHTKGSLVFHDRETGTLISGDTIGRHGFYPYGEWLHMDKFFDWLLWVDQQNFNAIASAHDRFLLPKDQIRYLIHTFLNSMHHPDSIWEQGGIRFAAMHSSAGFESPLFFSYSIKEDCLERIWKELNLWKENINWLNQLINEQNFIEKALRLKEDDFYENN